MNWSFDFGANTNQEKVLIGEKSSLAKVPGSKNLIIEIESETKLTLILM